MNPDVFQIVFPFWIKAFVFTLVVEIPLFVTVARFGRTADKTIPIWRLIIAGAAGTFFTHPLLWFMWPLVVANYTAYIVSGELIVATVESFTFFAIARPIKLSRAIAASFVANGVSFGLGVVIRLSGLMG